MNRSRPIRTMLAPLAAAVLGLSLANTLTACGRGSTEPVIDRGEPQAVYVVRGRIVEVPDPRRPGTQFQVEHEAIDDFKECSGRIVGMSAMVMPFPLEPGVSIAELSKGDIVEITFAVWCEPRLDYAATAVRKLPAETVLEFRAARPPQAQPVEDPDS